MNTKQKILKITRKILTIIFWFSIVGGTVIAIAATHKMEKKLTCKSLAINIMPYDVKFIGKKEINQIIKKEGYYTNNIIGQSLYNLNYSDLEKVLKKEIFIKNSEVFSDLNGNLNVKIEQRNPLLRIFKYDGIQFYVDKDGIKLPISENYSARVLVANGNIFEQYEVGDSLYSMVGRQLYKIATHVDNDTFLKAQIEQIFVDKDNEFILVPKVGNHTILLGGIENLENKFKMLKVFYKNGLNKTGWSKYNAINLKFKNQIICTRK